MDERRRYELYVVFQPELEEDQLETRIDRINGYLTNIGGEIVQVERRGKRRLAYYIGRYNQGLDVIYQADLPSVRLETIERQLNLFEDVLRYLVVRMDEVKQAKSAPAPAAQPQAEANETAPQPVVEMAQPTPPDIETPTAAEAAPAEPSEAAPADEAETANTPEPVLAAETATREE